MLIEKMHNLSNSKAAKFILGLITLSFLVGGMSGYLFSSMILMLQKLMVK